MLEWEAFGIRSFKGYQRLHCIMLGLRIYGVVSYMGRMYDP